MHLRYSRSIALVCLAAILIIIAGCGGSTSSSGNSPSTHGTPAPGSNPGGGGNPQSKTFVYVAGTRSGQPSNTFAFRLNSDGSTAAVPGAPFTNPQEVLTQAGNFLIGHDSSGFKVALYPVDANTGAPQAPASVSNVTARVVVADAANVYAAFPGSSGNDAIDALAISDGKLTAVSGSPFTAPGANFYAPLFLTSSLLFVDRNTDPLAPGAGTTQNEDITVFSRSANGALVRFASIGPANSSLSAVVHPGTRFIFKLDTGSGADCTLDVFSFDAGSGASALVQQVPFLGCTVRSVAGDKQGRFLFVTGNAPGIHVFSIDQNSGKISEVSGSPFFATDNTINGSFADPSGRFLLVVRGNSFQAVAIDASTGKLTPVAAPVTVNTEAIGRVTFAVF